MGERSGVLRHMRTSFAKSLGLSNMLLLVLGTAFSASGFDEKDRDKEQGQFPVEVFEWSIWVGNPAQSTINTARVYKNAMPGVVGTSRPKLEEKDRTNRFPVAPITVVQFFGESRRDIDIDLRAKKG